MKPACPWSCLKLSVVSTKANWLLPNKRHLRNFDTCNIATAEHIFPHYSSCLYQSVSVIIIQKGGDYMNWKMYDQVQAMLGCAGYNFLADVKKSLPNPSQEAEIIINATQTALNDLALLVSKAMRSFVESEE